MYLLNWVYQLYRNTKNLRTSCLNFISKIDLHETISLLRMFSFNYIICTPQTLNMQFTHVTKYITSINLPSINTFIIYLHMKALPIFFLSSFNICYSYDNIGSFFEEDIASKLRTYNCDLVMPRNFIKDKIKLIIKSCVWNEVPETHGGSYEME